MLRNVTALALLVALAGSNHAARAAGLDSAAAVTPTRHLATKPATAQSVHGDSEKVKQHRNLKTAGCSIKPGANSTSDANGNEAVQRPITKKPKTPKPSKTSKPSKQSTAAPVTSAPAPSSNDDDGSDDWSVTPAPVDDDDNDDSPVTSAPSSDDDDGDLPVTSAPVDDGDDDGDDSPVTTAAPIKTPAPATNAPTKTPMPVTPDPTAGSGSDDDGEGNDATPAPSSDGNATTPISKSDKLCAVPKLTVSDINVGATVLASEDEVALKVVAIAPKPSGGSHIAFHTSGGKVQVMELDASDKLVTGSTVTVNVVDFADIYADAKGFVVLGTRAAQGGGTLNCGNPSNLCGTAPSPAVPCYDMYLIRFEGGKEVWATKLTTSSASLPPYSSSKTGPDVYMIWWYAHHGRIAYDGTNWAAYFGVAISTSEGGCINIHQGDRMQVVGPTGALVQSKSAFALGCSHSGYERITYDPRASDFAMICKTDNNNRIKFPTSDATIYPVDLAASNLGDIVPSAASGYWMTVSNGAGSNAKVHLMHFEKNKAQDKDIVLGGAMANERACHLAPIGSGGLLAAWEGASAGGDLTEGAARTLYVQVRDAKDGAKVSDAIKVDASVKGNRYQVFRAFPDGSVAYLSKGTSATSLKLLRITPC